MIDNQSIIIEHSFSSWCIDVTHAENTRLETTLVRISANWSSDRILGNCKMSSSNFSLMKNLSTSTCFVRSCWTKLWAISQAALLPQYNRIGCVDEYPKSLKRFLSHNVSQRASAIPLNSASALERATTFWLLLIHVTRLPYTKVKYLKLTFNRLLILPNLHLCMHLCFDNLNFLWIEFPFLGQISNTLKFAWLHSRVSRRGYACIDLQCLMHKQD